VGSDVLRFVAFRLYVTVGPMTSQLLRPWLGSLFEEFGFTGGGKYWKEPVN
jgi:hypothetical protein